MATLWFRFLNKFVLSVSSNVQTSAYGSFDHSRLYLFGTYVESLLPLLVCWYAFRLSSAYSDENWSLPFPSLDGFQFSSMSQGKVQLPLLQIQSGIFLCHYYYWSEDGHGLLLAVAEFHFRLFYWGGILSLPVLYWHMRLSLSFSGVTVSLLVYESDAMISVFPNLIWRNFISRVPTMSPFLISFSSSTGPLEASQTV